MTCSERLKRDSIGLTRTRAGRGALWALGFALGFGPGCGSTSTSDSNDSSGGTSSGGAASGGAASGGDSSSGGSASGSGATAGSTGGTSSGGSTSDGGAPASGGSASCSSESPCEGGACTGTSCSGEWSCVSMPCTKNLVEYCGCDGVTFTSSGNCPSEPYVHEGACKAENLVDCNEAHIVCQPLVPPPPCPAGQAYSVVDGCHGACVPVGRCACDSHDDCPDPNDTDEFACFNDSGTCGYWVR